MKKGKIVKEKQEPLFLEKKCKIHFFNRSLIGYFFLGVISIAIVIGGNQWSDWVGIIIGSVLVIWGFLMFFHSSQYVRKAWSLEIRFIDETDEQTRKEMQLELSRVRGFIDVNRNWGMALLTMAGGVFAITAISSLIRNIQILEEIIR